MAVPTDITDLDTTSAINSPSGSETIGVSLDNYIRAIQAIVKQNVSKGSNIASSSTISIPSEGSYFEVTGTTGITGINDTWNGRVVILKFNDIVTLTNSAGLILFGSNITTAAGDVLTLVNESTGVYRAISWIKATDDSVTLSDTQTLTNKTIVVASNTVTTAASGNLVATELNAALAELDADVTTKVSKAGDTMTAPLWIEAGASGVNLIETGVTADNTTWSLVADGEELSIRAYNDALDSFQQAIAISRTDEIIDDVALLHPSTTTTPTVDADLAPKGYVDGTFDNSEDGYQVLPSGLIMQWGHEAAGAGAKTITFPLEFPSGVYNISVMPITTQETEVRSSTVSAVSTTQFTLHRIYLNTVGLGPWGEEFYWSAIGY